MVFSYFIFFISASVSIASSTDKTLLSQSSCQNDQSKKGISKETGKCVSTLTQDFKDSFLFQQKAPNLSMPVVKSKLKTKNK